MGEKLSRLTAKQIIKILEKINFEFVRQKGSHKIYKNKDKKRVTVPFHSNKILHPKIIKSILKDAELNIERLKKIL